jgi:RNase P subunit RPR2
MFDHFCTACRRRRLIFPSQVAAIVNDERGVHVRITCWCGADQTIETGRAADRPRPRVAA